MWLPAAGQMLSHEGRMAGRRDGGEGNKSPGCPLCVCEFSKLILLGAEGSSDIYTEAS